MKLPQRSPLPRGLRRAAALAIAALAALPLLPRPAAAGPTLLIDVDSGRVLEHSGESVRWYPASLTKLMTVYVVLKAVESGRVGFDTPVVISDFALSQAPSKMGFPVGSRVTIGDALKMLMVKSANDIAVALAEGVAGSVPAFVAEMNLAAARLGMADTHFVNPNGLPEPGQMTTAHDLAVLARALFKEYPGQARLFDIRALQIAGRVLRNHNHLIGHYAGVDGMKTGYICSSGYNIVASATRGSKHLLAVVLGAHSGHQRSEIVAALFEDGFSRPFFDLSGERLDALPRPETASADPVDMRPILCAGRRRGKKAPPLPPDPVPFDAHINVEAGRLALANPAAGDSTELAAQAAAKPIPVSAVMPAGASLTAQSLTPGMLAGSEEGEGAGEAKQILGKATARPAAAAAFADAAKESKAVHVKRPAKLHAKAKPAADKRKTHPKDEEKS